MRSLRWGRVPSGEVICKLIDADFLPPVLLRILFVLERSVWILHGYALTVAIPMLFCQFPVIYR